MTVVVLISGAFLRSRLITKGFYTRVTYLHIAVPTITRPYATRNPAVRNRETHGQFHNLNKRQGSFPHHSFPPCNLYKWKVFLNACRNTAAYCIIFLTVWNSWLRQQILKIPSLYKVSLSFRWNDEGKQAVKTKAECFKAWRLFLFSSLFLSTMHYWPSVRSVWLDIWPNSFFAFC